VVLLTEMIRPYNRRMSCLFADLLLSFQYYHCKIIPTSFDLLSLFLKCSILDYLLGFLSYFL